MTRVSLSGFPGNLSHSATHVKIIASIAYARSGSFHRELPRMRFPYLRTFHFSFVDRAFRGSSGSPSASNSFELVQSDNVRAPSFSVLIPDLRAAYNQCANDCNHCNDCSGTYPPAYDRLFYEGVYFYDGAKKKYRREYAKRVDKTRQHSAWPRCFDCQQTSAIGIERAYNWFKTEIRIKTRGR